MQQYTYPVPSWRRPLDSWAAAFTPQRCEVCGRPVGPALSDWPGQWAQALYGPLGEGVGRAWAGVLAPWIEAFQPGAWAGGPRPVERCGCRDCLPDRCHCQCCVSDADLVIYARVGERRVAPLVVENNIRRERSVELELSSFAAHSASPAHVNGSLVGPPAFTLKACEEHTVPLQVDVTAGPKQGTEAAGDVESCTVFYADLRVKGCDLRSTRIAVAVLPRDCAAYRIDCRATCC